jgi:diguanylate cyclase (GGDEF)-like protein
VTHAPRLLARTAQAHRFKLVALDFVPALLREASAPRLRAATRARIRASVRTSMWLALLAAAVDCAWLLPTHPESGDLILAANGCVAVAALIAVWALGRERYLAPELVLFGMLALVDVSIGAVIGIDVPTSVLCAGYVLLLPPTVAVLIPWSTTLHVTWLVTHALAALLMCDLVPPAVSAFDGPQTLLALLVVASAASVLGHLANLRARVASFVLIEQIRAMNRHARRDEATLRQLNMRLALAAWSDPLTGLGNRGALQRDLVAIRSRIERFGDRYVLLLADIDHFKVINDRLGHFAGDDVLRRVARTLADAARASDVSYRFGGEEFLSIVAVRAPGDARIAAERLRRAVAALGVVHPDNPRHGVVTVSIGAHEIGGSSLDEPDEAWLQRADDALYRAKRLGRNRVVIA